MINEENINIKYMYYYYLLLVECKKKRFLLSPVIYYDIENSSKSVLEEAL